MRSAKPKRSVGRAGGKRIGRVLLVEDDAVLSLALEDALIQAGAAEVITCSTIAATMQALEESEADVVVLDVHLADRDDGWALAELVDQLGPKRPRIVFSTGSPGDIPPAIAEMGMVFEKPYDPAQLAHVLASGEQKGLFARLRGAIG
jgi:DNA-binding NtrC family response regulator